MSLTPSTMLPLGTEAPDFALPDTVTGTTVSLSDSADAKALLVMFICNHCPYVVHIRDAFGPLARDYAPQGLAVVAISSNSLRTHPQDGPERMQALARDLDWPFPYLFDESQAVAKAYQAACTPDFFLFDGARKLHYRGQLDGARPGSPIPVTGVDLRAAIDSVLAGEPPPAEQVPAIGCNIKWERGNEPDYFE